MNGFHPCAHPGNNDSPNMYSQRQCCWSDCAMVLESMQHNRVIDWLKIKISGVANYQSAIDRLSTVEHRRVKQLTRPGRSPCDRIWCIPHWTMFYRPTNEIQVHVLAPTVRFTSFIADDVLGYETLTESQWLLYNIFVQTLSSLCAMRM